LMKRILTIKRLIFALAISFLFTSPETSSADKIPERKEVLILLSSANRFYEEGLIGLRSTLKVEPKIQFVDIVESQYPNIEDYFKEVQSSKPDLVIAFGLKAAQLAKQYLQNIPIMFSMVNSPKTLDLSKDRICGVVSEIAVKEYFQALKDISPNLKKVYSFYSDQTGEQQATEGDFNDLMFNFLYKKRKLNPDVDFKSVLNELKGEVQAIYMVNDRLYNQKNFEILSRFCKENKVILITSFPSILKAGATFSISPDYNKIGVSSGELANRILFENQQCKEGPFLFLQESIFSVNETYANESGVTIPPSIVERARLSRIFSKGVYLLNTGKVKSAKNIFVALSKKDPDNKPIKEYIQKATEKLTGDQTRKLLSQGKEQYEKKNFASAVDYFKKVLSLNPDSVEAQHYLEESRKASSDVEFNEALNLLSRGRIFDCYKKLKVSVDTYPNNQKAKDKMAQVRSSEFPRIPEYLQKGNELYNARKYKQALEIFEHIVLLFPENKEAMEYSRLSRKKEKALADHLNCSEQRDKKCLFLWKK